MEIIFNHIENDVSLYVARKLDSIESINLQELLSESELITLNKISAIRRKIEFVSVRSLLKQVLPLNTEQILYTKSGKPYIKNYNISISHSQHYVTIIISNSKSVAIDIEEYRDSIHTASKKFLNTSEIIKYKTTDDLTLVWCAKESIYKLFEASPDFKTDYNILNYTNTQIEATLSTKNFEKHINLMYIRCKEYCLVWCSNP